MSGKEVRRPALISRFSESSAASQLSPIVRYLDQLDNVDGVFRFRDHVGRIVFDPAINNVLELGCGAGTLSAILANKYPKKKFTGIDISPALLSVAQQRHLPLANLQFVAGSAEEIAVEGACFDAVIMERVLQHCSDPSRVIAECVRVCTDRAILLVCEPDWSGITCSHPDKVLSQLVFEAYQDAIRSPSVAQSLGGMLKSAGADVISIQRDDWSLGYPLSAKVIGLDRLVQIVESRGMSSQVVQPWAMEFERTRASITLPFYHVMGRVG